MKKLIVLILSVLFVLTGCNEASPNTEKPHQTLTATEISYQDNWLQNSLSKVGLENITIGEILNGQFSLNDTASGPNAYILSDYLRYSESGIFHDSYLAVETQQKVLFKDLSNEDIGSYADKMYACDVDGDRVDEIIVQQTVGLTGGAGQYLSRIFKVVENEILEIFNSSSLNKYDTGFISTLNDDFKLNIKNKFTEYTLTVDLKGSEQYIGIYYDENGNAIGKGDILCDSFNEFAPIDTDGDGVFEISCRQYVSLYSHADYIGDANSIIKFSSQTQKFEVIKAEFVLTK